MKNRKLEFRAIVLVLAFALAPIVLADRQPQGGPTGSAVNDSISYDGENLPVVTIYSADNVTRGKTGSFILNMKPAIMFGGLYVKYTVSGTAIPGVDYVALVSPAYIGQSGYGAILIQTLPDPRASSKQAYSVVITLEPGLGYWVGQPKSATMWIKPL
jgi:hypothetical protein